MEHQLDEIEKIIAGKPKKRKNCKSKKKKVVASSLETPLTWRQVTKLSEKLWKQKKIKHQDIKTKYKKKNENKGKEKVVTMVKLEHYIVSNHEIDGDGLVDFIP
jgi:hypothetical protein